VGAQAARSEHRSELGSLQDREGSLTAERTEMAGQLAAIERRRQESDAAARKAEALSRSAEERAAAAQAAQAAAEREAEERAARVAALERAAEVRERPPVKQQVAEVVAERRGFLFAQSLTAAGAAGACRSGSAAALLRRARDGTRRARRRTRHS
jgi:Skp family chaperone for outer membrane proteins